MPHKYWYCGTFDFKKCQRRDYKRKCLFMQCLKSAARLLFLLMGLPVFPRYTNQKGVKS